MYLFALLTDFGLNDPYVGQIKAVILDTLPQSNFIDLSHGIQAQNILQASFFLDSSWPYLPKGCICLGVVDPGVGSLRNIALIKSNKRWAILPDNGLVSLLLKSDPYAEVWLRSGKATPLKSSTFHGRDLFAPLGVELAKGKDPDELGEKVSSETLVRLSWPTTLLSENRLSLQVVHVDRFGNCVLNLKTSRKWKEIIFSQGCLSLQGPISASIQAATCYAELKSKTLGLLPGSQGYWELALNQDNCAKFLGAEIGTRCELILDSIEKIKKDGAKTF